MCPCVRVKWSAGQVLISRAPATKQRTSGKYGLQRAERSGAARFMNIWGEARAPLPVSDLYVPRRRSSTDSLRDCRVAERGEIPIWVQTLLSNGYLCVSCELLSPLASLNGYSFLTLSINKRPQRPPDPSSHKACSFLLWNSLFILNAEYVVWKHDRWST